MGKDIDMSILHKVDLFVDRVMDAGATERLETPKSINETGGFYERLIDIGTDFSGNGGLVDIPNAGYGLVFAIQGSTPGADLNVSFDGSGGAQVTNFRPGAFYKAPFGRIILTKSPACIAAGTIRLLFLTRNDVDYTEFFSPSSGSKVANVNGQGPNSVATQVQATASRGANSPVAATDGFALGGVRGFVVYVKSTLGAKTITAGNIRFWRFDPVSGLWARGTLVSALDTGGIIAVVTEFPVVVPVGRGYIECDGVTFSAADTITVIVTTFGD